MKGDDHSTCVPRKQKLLLQKSVLRGSQCPTDGVKRAINSFWEGSSPTVLG